MKVLKIVFIYFLLVACAAPSSEAQTVYITRTGSKYHASSCQYLRKSKYEITMKEAISRGFEACSVCEPGGLPKTQKATEPVKTVPKSTIPADKSKNPSPSKQKEVKSRQCAATTKAGTRCKRMTTNASGKCYQHE